MRTDSMREDDVAEFETLAESQKHIGGVVESIVQGLDELRRVSGHMASLEAELAGMFQGHREMAIAKSNLRQDKEFLEKRFQEKSDVSKALSLELDEARADLADTRNKLEKALSDLEGAVHRQYLLSVEKKEADDSLSAANAQLQSAKSEAEGLALEVSSLRQQLEASLARIGELTESYNDTMEKYVYFSNRCESFEGNLKAREEEVAFLKEKIELISHERDIAVHGSQQRDQELNAARTELSKMFEKTQGEVKAKDFEINKLKNEIDSLKASMKMLEQISANVKLESDNNIAQINHLREQNKQLEVTVGRLEAREKRLAGNLEHVTTAKKELDQSRATMSARLDSVTQALRAREADVKRLEGDVLRLTCELEEQNAASRDTIEALNNRLHQMEKDLVSQKSEVAFYATQAESVKKIESRA